MPKELLDATRRRGKIYLKFASEEHFRLARAVILAFKSSVGQKYEDLQEKLRHMERAENYRKVRGFAKILERESEFTTSSSLDPLEVRRFLFSRGYVTSEIERAKIIAEAATYFNTTPEEIERAMFADREEEKILTRVPGISEEELIRRYNLSLLQTLMFNSARMSFRVSENHKRIFRLIKLLGLMYEISGENIEITGPASILKMTRKYGTSMAKLIPEIVKAKEWAIKAEIIEDKRVYFFELSSEDDILLPKLEVSVEYDSSLEREFVTKIKRILGVEVIREPGIIKAGQYAYIPDFLIRKNGKEVYVEIAGFWTRSYIKSKLEKLSNVDVKMLIIVNDELLADKLGKIHDVIVMRKGKIPYKEVILKLKEMLN